MCSLLALAATSALGGDCSTSSEFLLPKPQVLAGTFADPMNLPLPGLEIQVLRGRSVLLAARTDGKGAYGFGVIAPGKYRLRIVSQPFCAPKVKCRNESCTVATTLRLNEKKAKSEIVY